MAVDWKEFGARLRHAISLRGHSINKFQQTLKAQDVPGSSYSMVHKYIKGETPPPADFIVAAADELGVSVEWLLTDRGLVSGPGGEDYQNDFEVATLMALWSFAPEVVGAQLDFAAYSHLRGLLAELLDDRYTATRADQPINREGPAYTAWVQATGERVAAGLMAPLFAIEELGVPAVPDRFSGYLALVCHALHHVVTYEGFAWGTIQDDAERLGFTGLRPQGIQTPEEMRAWVQQMKARHPDVFLTDTEIGARRREAFQRSLEDLRLEWSRQEAERAVSSEGQEGERENAE